MDELRLRATELAIDGELAAGRHRELIGELEALVAAHPLSERLHGQRMLALYRSGRQAEALAAYRDARRVLVDEIGVEPDRELRRLHDAILRQDAALDLPAAVAPSAAVSSPVAADRRAPPVAARTPGRRVLVAAAALVLVGGLAVFAVSRWSGPERIGVDRRECGRRDRPRDGADHGAVRGRARPERARRRRRVGVGRQRGRRHRVADRAAGAIRS